MPDDMRALYRQEYGYWLRYLVYREVIFKLPLSYRTAVGIPLFLFGFNIFGEDMLTKRFLGDRICLEFLNRFLQAAWQNSDTFCCHLFGIHLKNVLIYSRPVPGDRS